MQTLEAVRHMIKTSGTSASDLSRCMGKGRTHWSVAFAKNVDPKVSTLVEAAHVMGYTVMLEGHGERIEIDPLAHEDQSKPE